MSHSSIDASNGRWPRASSAASNISRCTSDETLDIFDDDDDDDFFFFVFNNKFVTTDTTTSSTIASVLINVPSKSKMTHDASFEVDDDFGIYIYIYISLVLVLQREYYSNKRVIILHRIFLPKKKKSSLSCV